MPDTNVSMESVLSQADQAMYAEKRKLASAQADTPS